MCDIRKTSDKWADEYEKSHGIVILDPDGWDRNNYEYSFYEEEITRKEFLERLAYSTLMGKFVY